MSIGLWANMADGAATGVAPKVPWDGCVASPKMSAIQGGSMNRNFVTLTATLISTLACASGGSTSLTNTWRAPETDRLAFHRVLASFVSTDPSTRRRRSEGRDAVLTS